VLGAISEFDKAMTVAKLRCSLDLPPPPPAIVRQYASPDFGQLPPGEEWLAYAQQSPGLTLAPLVKTALGSLAC